MCIELNLRDRVLKLIFLDIINLLIISKIKIQFYLKIHDKTDPFNINTQMVFHIKPEPKSHKITTHHRQLFRPLIDDYYT